MPKYEPLIDIKMLFRNPDLADEQGQETTRKMASALEGKVWHPKEVSQTPHALYDTWQKRFEEEAIIKPIPPDRVGLSAHRVISDLTISSQDYEYLFSPVASSDPSHESDRTLEDAKLIIKKLRRARKKFAISKQTVKTDTLLEISLTENLKKHKNQCVEMMGGQAGNITWFLHALGTDPLVYTPYISEEVMKVVADLEKMKDWLRVVSLQNDSFEVHSIDKTPKGIKSNFPDGFQLARAPSNKSVIVLKNLIRLIFAFDGFRDFSVSEESQMPFHVLQLQNGSMPLGTLPYEDQKHKLNWPQLGLFCECRIDNDTLIISLPDASSIIRNFTGNADFAVIGGMDAIFIDKWFFDQPTIQDYLTCAVQDQMLALKDAGLQIGVEISKPPDPNYFEFLCDLGRQNIINALGINGEDELSKWHDNEELSRKYPLFNSELLPTKWRKLAGEIEPDWKHFEYITYLRALGLVNYLGVKRLYVHTNAVDFILIRDATPTELETALDGCMQGKSSVMGALARRSWKEDYMNYIDYFPPVILPAAMEKLVLLIDDLFHHAHMSQEDASKMLETGLWQHIPGSRYSLAVAPVLWPAHPSNMPKALNTTGAGDMSFGAFMLFGCNC